MTENRAIVVVLDSVGIGGAKDAHLYNDEGANTLGHIVEQAAAGKANNVQRSGPLNIPNLTELGLINALHLSSGVGNPPTSLTASWGVGVESSKGKDTTSGHWEIAGTPVRRDFHYFPDENPAFPQGLLDDIERLGNLPGTLSNTRASGTQVIEDFGAEHVRTRKPILYTSTDSVLQIAAHEHAFGLERLYELCGYVRALVDPLGVGRVIARPFEGEEGNFIRTPNRRDFSMPPFDTTLLDDLKDQGREVMGIGKISDIFAGRGITCSHKATGIDGTTDVIAQHIPQLAPGGLMFANIVEFDSDYGHRRDVAGYAWALETFDMRVRELLTALKQHDILIITADHGNDPTWRGTDHTREHVPIIMVGKNTVPRPLGMRGFADITASIAEHLHIKTQTSGESFLFP
ncbi:MAG: phosphopentomutase [Hyphomicrobiales bacterium]